MRCEIYHYIFSRCVAKLLLDLGCMSVTCDTVRLAALIYFAVEICNLCASSCARNTAKCINDKSFRIDKSLFYKRICRKYGACRIATGICDKSRILYLVPVYLTESVNCFFNKLRRFMLYFIPFFVNRNIF